MKKRIHRPYKYKKPKDVTVEEWRDTWCVPDWREYSEYPKNLNKEQIKWEFVRRDSDYRLVWEYYQEEKDKHISLTHEEFEDSIFNPIASSIEYDLEDLIDPSIHSQVLGKRIFVNIMRGRKIKNIVDDKVQIDRWHIPTKSILTNSKSIIAFDLQYSLKKQIEDAEKLLIKEQNKFAKEENIKPPSEVGPTKDYIKHLQLLDAYYERIPFSEIGDKVFGIKDRKESGDRARFELKRVEKMWRSF